ncbi:hypothetical protein UFOVP1349_58, partial [uncultured Caudovirales phage]
GEQPASEASTENAEPKADETSEGEESDKPNKLSRNQRLQRKAARLSTMVAEQAARIEELQRSSNRPDETEPNEAEYNGDWTKFQADYAAWKAAKTVTAKFDEREQRDNAARLQERRQESIEDFQERAEQVKVGIADFDKTLEAFANNGGKFAGHVREELLESDKGPMLAYQLAKNPQLAAELNAMSPRDAAREFGRLEAKVSLPQPKRQTQAPAPLSALTGGAAKSTDIYALAKSDDASAYIAARKAEQKART